MDHVILHLIITYMVGMHFAIFAPKNQKKKLRNWIGVCCMWWWLLSIEGTFGVQFDLCVWRYACWLQGNTLHYCAFRPSKMGKISLKTETNEY